MTAKLAPKRRYSQNFLTDGRTAAKIASFLEATPDDVVVEIGPGAGALTQHLVQLACQKVITVDLDPRTEEALAELRGRSGARLDVRIGDILEVSIPDVFVNVPREHRLVIGNIPYAITSDILFWLFEAREQISRAVIMMQKEVALRCTARPGTKDYGILSVATWYTSTASLVLTVQPGSFFPRPSVTSAVVRFRMRTQFPPVPFAPFMTFVRAAFSQRRKVLSNALATWARNVGVDLKSIALPQELQIATQRAEALSPEQLVELYQRLTTPALEHVR